MYLVLGKQVLEAEILALVWVCVESVLGRVELFFHLEALFVCHRRSGTRSRNCPHADWNYPPADWCAGQR
jgi:hypothetical protein